MWEDFLNGFFLQDIYGDDNFPTTHKESDILKFKPMSQLNPRLIKFN